MRIIPVVLGSVMLLIAFMLFFGGGVVLWVSSTLKENNMFTTVDLHTDSHALVLKNINVNLGNDWWRPTSDELTTIRISLSGNDPSKKAFLGIANAAEAGAYLRGARYDELTDVRISSGWKTGPFGGFSITFDRMTHQGEQPLERRPPVPLMMSFWDVFAHGSGTQTLSWSPRTGTYWVVLMNEDASPGVDVKLGLGAELPILSTIGAGLLMVAFVFAGGGAALLYFGLRRRYEVPPPPAKTRNPWKTDLSGRSGLDN